MMNYSFILQGTVTEIGDMVQIRRTTKPDIYKKILAVETMDNQKVYMEIRNTGIKELEREGIEEGSLVEIEYLFEGSEKDGKKYNNVVIKNIRLLR